MLLQEAIIENGSIDKSMSGVLDRSRVLISEVPKKTFDTTSLVQDLNTVLVAKVSLTHGFFTASTLCIAHKLGYPPRHIEL